MAGCAIPTSSAGHAPAGAEANPKLTFNRTTSWGPITIKVGDIRIDALRSDRDQLFAEAVCLCREGVEWWPNADFERKHIMPEQEARYEADEWEDPIGKYLAGTKRTTISQIAKNGLSIDASKLGTHDQRRIRIAMERLGWERGKREGTARWWCQSL